MNLTLIASLVSAALAGLVGWSAAWTLQGRAIDALKLGAANERITIQRANRQNTERLAGQISQAQEDAQRLLSAATRERDSALESARRLRDTSSTTMRTATETPATCSRITNAYNIVFSESIDFIREVAADVDRCAIERQALSDAWPKKD